MARKTTKVPLQTFTEIKHFDSAAEIDRAIEKLKRCKDLLDELWDGQAAYDDPRTRILEHKIRTNVLEIFGPNSPEFGRHRYHRIWHGPEFVNMPEHEIQTGFRLGFSHTGVMLKSLIDVLEERGSELGQDPTAKSRDAFEQIDLHLRIAGVCSDLYRDGHYRQAVLDASIALVNYVREKSRRHDLDGSGLMSTVFSPHNPVVALNDLSSQSERDEQEGFMHLFMGAVLALRNPRAHAVFDDSPEMALDYIAFLSMLAKRLDGAKRA